MRWAAGRQRGTITNTAASGESPLSSTCPWLSLLVVTSSWSEITLPLFQTCASRHTTCYVSDESNCSTIQYIGIHLCVQKGSNLIRFIGALLHSWLYWLFFVSKCKVEVRPLAQLGHKKEKGGSLIGDDEKMLPSL